MIKIRVDASDIKRLAEFVKKTSLSKSQVQDIGEGTVSLMKSQISKGISTIAGGGRFPAYKNPARYPGKLKRQRPVNLYLTGDMLAALTVKADSPRAFTLGYFESSEAIKEHGHRDGANGQPRRPTIPEGSEEFNQTIQRQITRDFVASFEDEISKIGK